jgi:hypothetical protein
MYENLFTKREVIMKRLVAVCVALLLVVSVAGMQAQTPRVISYQGMLLGSNKLPVPDGPYTLTFKLYDQTSTVLWTEVQSAVPVVSGMFGVLLGTVTPLSIAFDKSYTLGIQVGSDPEMAPRVSLASVPYAIRADDADKLLGYSVNATPTANKLLPLDATGKFPSSAIPSSGTGDFIKKNTPDTSRATSASPLLLVSNLGAGDGINARSTNGTGLAGMSTNQDGVSGWTGVAGKSGVFGFSTDGVGLTGRSNNSDGVVGWTGAASKSGVFGHTGTAGANGVTGIADDATATGVYGYNSVSGNFAKLATDTHGLDVHGLGRFVLPSGQISVSTPGGWPGMISLSTNGHRRDMIVWDGGVSFEVSATSSAPAAGNGITILENGYVGVGLSNPGKKLDVLGTVRCYDLTLTGGSDIAEPFDVRAPEPAKPGMVMAIDPDNPGMLKVADTPYDTHVAGVISGAGNIMPGMLMSQSGSVANGKYPVALTGRVYCLADATDNPISPGDLLTTSRVPGYAMKVTNYSRSQGAILGKAMSVLDHGQGLVLILVTLQ